MNKDVKVKAYIKLKKAYAKLHKESIKEIYGSRKNFRKSLEERRKLNWREDVGF